MGYADFMGNSQIKKSTKHVKHPSDHAQSTAQLKEQIAQLKKDLLREREKLAAWYDIAEEGLFIHENFIIKEVNSALLKMTGYSKKELIDKHGKMLITEDSFEKLKKHISSFPGKLESGVRSTYHSARQAVGMNGGKSCGLYGGSNCQYTGGKRRRRKTQKKRSHRKH